MNEGKAGGRGDARLNEDKAGYWKDGGEADDMERKGESMSASPSHWIRSSISLTSDPNASEFVYIADVGGLEEKRCLLYQARSQE